MASLVATPNPAKVGDSIALLGEGFAASTATAVKIDSEGFAAEGTSDAGGLISNDDINDHADGTRANPANPATTDAGTTYWTGTVAHADVIAGAKTATPLAVVARVAGTGGNSIATTEASTALSW